MWFLKIWFANNNFILNIQIQLKLLTLFPKDSNFKTSEMEFWKNSRSINFDISNFEVIIKNVFGIIN